MKKSELNQNISMSKGNDHLKDNDEHNFYIFNLPSQKTCPFSTEICRKKCYAKAAENMFSTVRIARDRNFQESKKSTFEKDMIDWIEYLLQSKRNIGKTIILRIHESGDFYSEDYLRKWITITSYFKGRSILFQAYTKSILYFTDINLEELNISILYSVMPDTKKEDICIANKIGMNLFVLIEKDNDSVNGYICKRDCNNCMSCYNMKNKITYINEHGAGIKSKQKHSLDRFTEYKKKNKM